MNKKPQIRFLKEMKDVIYDKKWAKTAPNFELYYVWRAMKRKGELRYDITYIPPLYLGKEFVRTKGNRNSKNFPELYTVLRGKAIFLIQKTKGKIVEDILFVRAKKGNWVVIPPKYAVVTINPGKEILKTGNWVSEKNQNIYKEIEARKGPCYFYTKKGWIKNKNYKNIPKIRSQRPLKSRPKNLDFLKG